MIANIQLVFLVKDDEDAQEIFDALTTFAEEEGFVTYSDDRMNSFHDYVVKPERPAK